MLAVKGVYNDGLVILEDKPSVKSAEVIVVFPDANERKEKTELSEYDRRKLFEEFSGSVNRIIDEKAERMGALDEKYQGVD